MLGRQRSPRTHTHHNRSTNCWQRKRRWLTTAIFFFPLYYFVGFCISSVGSSAFVYCIVGGSTVPPSLDDCFLFCFLPSSRRTTRQIHSPFVPKLEGPAQPFVSRPRWRGAVVGHPSSEPTSTHELSGEAKKKTDKRDWNWWRDVRIKAPEELRRKLNEIDSSLNLFSSHRVGNFAPTAPSLNTSVPSPKSPPTSEPFLCFVVPFVSEEKKRKSGSIHGRRRLLVR